MSFRLSLTPLRGGLVLLSALAPLWAQAQTAPDWTLNLNNPSARPSGNWVDAQSNVYSVSAGGGSSGSLNKFNAARTLVWSRPLFNGDQGRVSAHASDGNGNSWVVGELTDSQGLRTGTLVARYDSAGQLLWREARTVPREWPAMVAADANGAAYVVFSVLRLNTSTGRYEPGCQLVRYGSAGERQWSADCGRDALYYRPGALNVWPNGQVAVIGDDRPGITQLRAFSPSGGLVVDRLYPFDLGIGAARGPNGEFALVGGAAGQTLVVRFDASLNELWRLSFPLGQLAQHATFEGQGGLVLGSGTLNNGQLSGSLLSKISAAGSVQWSRPFETSADGLVPSTGLLQGLADGGVMVAANSPALVAGSAQDRLVLARLDAAGRELWRSTPQLGYSEQALALSANGGALLQLVPTASGSSAAVLAQRYAQSGVSNQAPLAQASASPSSGIAPLSVQFSAAGSSDPEGGALSYAWNFGDGRSSTLSNPALVFGEGIYNVQLTVTDALGAQTKTALTVTSTLAPAQPTQLSLASSNIVQNTSTTATLQLSSTAGTTVTLSASDPSLVSLPLSITVPKGQQSTTFGVTAKSLRKQTTVTLRATANGKTVSSLLTIRPR
ncbi:hypothetical protein HNQ51_000235 [Inhella inkyongensis]|uniref:PKD domain-containing protein n=1 Tax=Inhella inkyongensis TaxID=392593 RepID=A0A840S0B0_9BURK|nr:PKD domain-containing protein [Inhella inkyongensis]MBB5202942.1 hypothetical protein [Inhella inkyongensis]